MKKLITLSQSDVNELRSALKYLCEQEVEDFEEQLKERGVSYHDEYSTRDEFTALFCGERKWHIFQTAMSLLLDLNAEDNS